MSRPSMFAFRFARNLQLRLCGGLGLALVALACARDAPPTPARPTPARPRAGLTANSVGPVAPLARLEILTPAHRLAPLLPSAERRARALAPRASAWGDEPSNAARLTRPLRGARWVEGRGATLLAALEALPPERRALGLAGFGNNELVGGLCESAAIAVELEHEGRAYEAVYQAEPFVWLTAPIPDLYALSSTCTAALGESGGALQQAVGGPCAPEDEAAHFPEGSRCRSCLEEDGDHPRCVAAGACRLERTREIAVNLDGRQVFLDVHQAVAVGCAPNLLAELVVLARELGEDDDPIQPFDHSRVEQVCRWQWSSGEGRPGLYCTSTVGEIRSAFADVVFLRTEHIRLAGDETRAYAGRLGMASSVEVEGAVFRGSPLYPWRLAEVSITDQSIGGWAMAPGVVRPGGDPGVLDDTYARDWLGAVALKTTTTIDGVPIAVYNRNLCTEDQWRGPDAEGRFFCRPGFFEDGLPPDMEAWSYDSGSYFISERPEVVEILPLVTLGATGRMDPRVPGGHLPHVLGTSNLADPDWEACAWPEQFVPDEKANWDSSVPGTYTFTNQTYRFGKDPTLDLRLVLATNWRRGFCFEPLPER